MYGCMADTLNFVANASRKINAAAGAAKIKKILCLPGAVPPGSVGKTL